MQKKQRRKLVQLTKFSRYRSFWRKLVRVLACIVVFCTTYALILPAITMDQSWYCGFDAHTHSDGCRVETSLVTFSCQPEAGVLHSHNRDCLADDGTLVCPWPEETGSTAPDSPEQSTHVHSEACRSVTVSRELLCTLPEHAHTDLCRPDPNFDLEKQADWEATFAHLTFSGQWRQDMAAMAKSQIGYTESLRNYTLDADGVRKGYTRYGQWFGTPYGQWDALFVSFCLHYAGVPHEVIPSAIHTDAWMTQLKTLGLLNTPEEKLPAAGDILFYKNEEGRPRAAVLTGLDSSDGKATGLWIVAGDVKGRVEQLCLEPGQLLAFCDLEYALQNRPSEITEVRVETENYIVTVRWCSDTALPEGARLQVTEYPKDSEIYLQRCREAGYALEWLLNIGFFLDGEELEPEGQFTVSVADKGGQALDTRVTHFAQGGPEQLEGTPEENGAVAFAADGFSDFGGAARAATDAAVVLELYSYNEWCPITFPTGNSYTAAVGSTVTLTFASAAGRYKAPELTVTGGQILSQTYSCSVSGCSHSWCTNPVHTVTLRITASEMYVRGFVGGSSSWENSSVTLSANSGGEAEPEDPTETTAAPEQADPTYPYHPHAVHTGEVNISRLRFYNLAEDGDNGVKPLPGCVFEITGPNGYSATVVSTDDVEVLLPGDIPDGTYTITEVSVPEGYLRDEKYTRSFEVKDGALTSINNIGTFINHDLRQLNSDKTAQVEDYNNRIYQVLLAAESHMRMYEMGPVDVLFVVDQSNSMLFPASLEETGKSVQLSLSGSGNVQRMEALDLDKNQMYYLISDPQGTSTVWCVWYNGQSWMYQDASYYAKAKHGNAEGYQAPNGEIAIFPENRSYADQANAEADNQRSNGGGLGYSLSGSGLGKDIDKYANDIQTYQLYTSPTEYNRLHYLEEALANMIYELADANNENRVTLTFFTKEVKPEDDLGPLELTPDNAEILVSAVRSINTDGGTRQDIALKHVYENHLNNASDGYSGDPEYTYTILITDGAPVLSGGSEITSLGSANDAASTTANSVYAQIKGYAQLVRSKSSLMTVGLGLDNVEAGRQVLEEIATNDDYYCAMEDASQLVHNLQRLLFDTFKPRDVIEIYADVTDEISDSFYPIAWVTPGTDAGRQLLVSSNGKDWILPVAGDWLTLEGALTAAGAEDAAGQLLQKSDGTWYVLWKNLEISDPNWHYDNDRIAWVREGTGASTGRTVVATYGGKDWILLNEGDWITQQGEYYAGTPNYYWQRRYGQIGRTGEEYYVTWGSNANGSSRERFVSEFGWHGTFYVKAKEDFIGGNAIDTNKAAWVTARNVSKAFPTPTVNVRLLDMNELSSRVTVYLGDTVNEEGHSPLDSVKAFHDQIHFTKLISDGGDVLNKVTSYSTEGLEAAVFYLCYALGRDITVDEWQTLVNGGTVTVPYTYDHPSSHGPVGQFTLTLEKTGMAGAKPSWDTHTAAAACQSQGTPLTEACEAPAETYTLNVVYTAYRLDEQGRPAENLCNDSKGPGTEVGTGTTLETGAGTVTSENVHEVHVISGSIEITKVFAAGLTDPEDRTFTFVLHRLEDGEDTANDRTQTVTVPAGQSQGSATALFTDLPRGTYTVTEALDEKYTVSKILVTGDTNCFSVPAPGAAADTVTFTLGHDPENRNVIGRDPPEEAYTSWVNPGFGVYGEAVFTNDEIVYYGEIPVKKVWSNGPESHTDADAVYAVLLKDGLPLTDKDGNAQLLRLDASSGWEGTFRVVLTGPEDSISNYSYSIREVSQITEELREGWTQALLVNDGTTAVWYETALEDGRIVGISGKGYVVQYETDENGVFIVRNIRAVELPSTGGMGTHLYTFGGLALLALTLLYGCELRRKRERGASG